MLDPTSMQERRQQERNKLCFYTKQAPEVMNWTMQTTLYIRSSLELVCSNVKGVLNDIISTLEGQTCSNKIDFAQYKIDCLIWLLLRMGDNLEESILPYLLQAKQALSFVKMGFKGRPIARFDISFEQHAYTFLIDNGFKVTDIASLLCVSCKTVYRRLKEYGISVRGTYAKLEDSQSGSLFYTVQSRFYYCMTGLTFQFTYYIIHIISFNI